MSLPAGFSTTRIDGLQCTAVPRTATTLPASLATLPAATPSTTSTTSTASSTQIIAAGATSTTAAQVATTSRLGTPVTSLVTSTSAVVLSTASAIASSSAIPASRITTPTTSSSTAVAIALSEVSASPTALAGSDDGTGLNPSRTTLSSSISSSTSSSSHHEESSAASGISSNPKLTAAPVVGGVVGSIALIAIIALIFYFFRKRRRGRESLLTPLTTGRRSSFYDADNASVVLSGRGGKWRAGVGYQSDKLRNVGAGMKAGIVGLGASLKSKVGGERSDTPNVNLNRGNSQFMDGPIPQHSRNNSVLSQNEKPSIKERAADWWEHLSEKISFAWRMRMGVKEPEDPFAAARSIQNEKQAKLGNPPDFSQLLRMDDRDLQLQAERRRLSLVGNTNSLPQLGSLGLNFASVGDDPFADPVKGAGWRPPVATNPASNPFADPATNRSNPFADPPTRPGATIPKANTYITDIRRSRGQSIDANTTSNNLTSMYRPPSTAVGSRYPSSIAPSRDSYRDTVFSSFSANVRKGKGRSDPFDLERPELWKPKDTNSTVMYPAALNTKSGAAVQGTSSSSRVLSNGSYLSKYSSGVSLGEWGDPGPDLGPGSGSSSLRGNASSNGGSQDLSAAARQYYTEIAAGGLNGPKENWDQNRGKNNVSPLSRTSSKGGVGKAM